MDIKKITEVITDPDITEEMKEGRILNILAMDKNAIPDLLKILAREREQKQEVITEMNLELSRSHVFIECVNPAALPKKEKLTSLGPQVTQTWILDQIAAFYIRNKGRVRYLYNRFD